MPVEPNEISPQANFASANQMDPPPYMTYMAGPNGQMVFYPLFSPTYTSMYPVQPQPYPPYTSNIPVTNQPSNENYTGSIPNSANPPLTEINNVEEADAPELSEFYNQPAVQIDNTQ